MSDVQPPRFAWSFDGKAYQGKFETREDALAFARRDTGGHDKVWTARRVAAFLPHPFDTSDLQERIRDDLRDQIGESADGYETTTEGDTAWNDLVGAWVEAHGLKSVEGFFSVADVEEHAP